MPYPGPGPSPGKLDESAMPKITISLPDSYADALASVANQARCDRAEIIRRAIGRYIEDFEDLSAADERLQDPDDPALPWDEVRNELLE